MLLLSPSAPATEPCRAATAAAEADLAELGRDFAELGRTFAELVPALPAARDGLPRTASVVTVPLDALLVGPADAGRTRDCDRVRAPRNTDAACTGNSVLETGTLV
jgi:hypothetical protein